MIGFASGQLVVGGRKSGGGWLSSVEIFPAAPSNTCFIPDLPSPREEHSISLLSHGRLVVCGGDPRSEIGKSCISWQSGSFSWTQLHTMRSSYHILFHKNSPNSSARRYHMAWTPVSFPDSIVLFGNWDGEARFTAEIVPGFERWSSFHFLCYRWGNL